MIARQYEEQGFIEPFALFDEQRFSQLRSGLGATLLPNRPYTDDVEMRHLKSPELYALCSAPALLDVVESILGSNVLLWRSRLFIKEPGGPEIPWHSDEFYFVTRLEPVVNVTAWIAIDDVDRGNACLRIIPGSHKRFVRHVKSPETVDPLFRARADPSAVDETTARYLEMKAGQCVVFNETVLHGSTANFSQRRRIGLSARFTIPSVKIKDADVSAIVVRGQDLSGFNQLVSPPQQVSSIPQKAVSVDS